MTSCRMIYRVRASITIPMHHEVLCAPVRRGRAGAWRVAGIFKTMAEALHETRTLSDINHLMPRSI